MSKSGALDLASGVGGKLEKKEMLSTVQRFFTSSLLSYITINLMHPSMLI